MIIAFTDELFDDKNKMFTTMWTNFDVPVERLFGPDLDSRLGRSRCWIYVQSLFCSWNAPHEG